MGLVNWIASRIRDGVRNTSGTELKTAYQLKGFHYSYQNAFGRGSYSVDIVKNGDGVVFSYNEDMGKYEYVPLESMVKATEVVTKIIENIAQ